MVKYVNFNEFDLETRIYRIISVERLFELFDKNENTLVSPSLWEDPFENFLSKVKIKVDGKSIFLNQRKWGQCWTTRIRETDAMWRIYSPLKDGVKIQTTVKKLVDSFLNSSQVISLIKETKEWNETINPDSGEPEVGIKLFCGKIKYLPVAKLINSNFLRSVIDDDNNDILFIKRMEFDHEKELRIVFEHYDPKLSWNGIEDSIFTYNFNFNDIVDSVVFDPRMPKSLFQAYGKYLSDKGFSGQIKQSGLYSLPKFNFNL